MILLLVFPKDGYSFSVAKDSFGIVSIGIVCKQVSQYQSKGKKYNKSRVVKFKGPDSLSE